MSEQQRLTYPMQLVPALKRGLLMGLAMGAAGLLNGRIGEGLLLIASFTGVGLMIARLALKTVVNREGFTLHGWHQFDWADVLDATVSADGLSMNSRNGRPAALPPCVVDDARFREAITRWLPSAHPVRGAMARSLPQASEDDAAGRAD
jgi:hypothetical protein